MVNELFAKLAACPETEAIALGGSRAGQHYDETSDYDVYIYCTAPIPEDTRKAILSEFCTVMEIGNHFWEHEDNCTLSDGTDIDLLYRNLDDFSAGIAEVVEQGHAHNGYTTCMWHNLLTCKILYDREHRLQAMQKRFTVPYPQTLKQNIIQRNLRLLRHSLPAYEAQIRKAVLRNDLVSINHRTAAFIASYFDILFAVNEMTHPGEKRLMTLCREHCRLLPAGFEENLNALFQDMFVHPDRIMNDLSLILSALEKII